MFGFNLGELTPSSNDDVISSTLELVTEILSVIAKNDGGHKTLAKIKTPLKRKVQLTQ